MEFQCWQNYQTQVRHCQFCCKCMGNLQSMIKMHGQPDMPMHRQRYQANALSNANRQHYQMQMHCQMRMHHQQFSNANAQGSVVNWIPASEILVANPDRTQQIQIDIVQWWCGFSRGFVDHCPLLLAKFSYHFQPYSVTSNARAQTGRRLAGETNDSWIAIGHKNSLIHY